MAIGQRKGVGFLRHVPRSRRRPCQPRGSPLPAQRAKQGGGPWLPGRKPDIEPLARMAPRDFYYLRVSNAKRFERFAGPLLEWASSLASWLEGNGRDFQLLERYQRQLLFPMGGTG